MKNIIFQYYIPKPPRFGEISRKSFIRYTKNVGAEYLYVNDVFMRPKHEYFEKLRLIYDTSFDKYDKLMFADMDVIAMPEAANIFDLEVDEIAGVPERNIPGMRVKVGWFMNKRPDQIKAKFKKHGAPLIKSTLPGSDYRMINTGVVIWTKKARLKAREKFDDWTEWTRGSGPRQILLDQPYLNAMWNKYKFNVRELDREWNLFTRHYELVDDPSKLPYSHFQHFTAKEVNKHRIIKWYKDVF